MYTLDFKTKLWHIALVTNLCIFSNIKFFICFCRLAARSWNPEAAEQMLREVNKCCDLAI